MIDKRNPDVEVPRGQRIKRRDFLGSLSILGAASLAGRQPAWAEVQDRSAADADVSQVATMEGVLLYSYSTAPNEALLAIQTENAYMSLVALSYIGGETSYSVIANIPWEKVRIHPRTLGVCADTGNLFAVAVNAPDSEALVLLTASGDISRYVYIIPPDRTVVQMPVYLPGLKRFFICTGWLYAEYEALLVDCSGSVDRLSIGQGAATIDGVYPIGVPNKALLEVTREKVGIAATGKRSVIESTVLDMEQHLDPRKPEDLAKIKAQVAALRRSMPRPTFELVKFIGTTEVESVNALDASFGAIIGGSVITSLGLPDFQQVLLFPDRNLWLIQTRDGCYTAGAEGAKRVERLDGHTLLCTASGDAVLTALPWVSTGEIGDPSAWLREDPRDIAKMPWKINVNLVRL